MLNRYQTEDYSNGLYQGVNCMTLELATYALRRWLSDVKRTDRHPVPAWKRRRQSRLRGASDDKNMVTCKSWLAEHLASQLETCERS